MKRFLAVILALVLCAAPVVIAATQDTEVSVGGYTTRTLVNLLYQLQTTLNEVTSSSSGLNQNNSILNNWNVALLELAADHDADKVVLDSWETLIEEIAADHDADNTALAAYETLLEEVGADHDADNDVIDDLKTLVNSLQDAYNESVVVHGNLVISATPEQFKTTTAAKVVIRGYSVSKDATDNLTFTAADTINTGAAEGDFWGAWKVQVALNGDVTTKSVSTDQVYADEAAAIAALPATDTGTAALGYITVQANSNVDWVANTDDLTAASDCQAANFYNTTVVSDLTAVSSSPAADLTASFVLSSVAANLAAGTTVDSVAANLTAAATTNVSDVSVTDSVLGSGTKTDPSISLTI